MNFVKALVANKLDEAKQHLMNRLNEIASQRLKEAKNYVVEDMLEEASNPNIIKQGRIQKIRRRIRRNKAGRIVVQKNRRRSGIKSCSSYICNNKIKEGSLTKAFMENN
jgi:hypothetical protein